MRYYSHVLRCGSASAIVNTPHAYAAWLGDFVMPLRNLYLHDKLWFTQYGDHYKLRMWCDENSYATIKPRVDTLMSALAIEFDPLHALESCLTVEQDLGNERFLESGRHSNVNERNKRAMLVLGYLDSIGSLVLDSLHRQNGHWAFEKTKHEENPVDSAFDSLVHLYGNMTDSRFPIFADGSQSPWGAREGNKVHKFKGREIHLAIFRY